MKTRKLMACVLVLLPVLALVGCGDDDGEGGGGGNVEASCQEYCAKVEPLNCPGTPAATCVADCKAAAAQAPEKCRSAVEKLNGCLARQPTSSFECDEFEGEATTKEGVCDGEFLALFACVGL